MISSTLYIKKPTLPFKRFDSWKLRRVGKYAKPPKFHSISADLESWQQVPNCTLPKRPTPCTTQRNLSLIHANEALY